MSELRTNLLSDLAGTGPAGLFKQSAAKAWANLNGTGTIALRQSFNVSSVVDEGTGEYRFNYTSAMFNGNDAYGFAGGGYPLLHLNTTSALTIRWYYPPGSPGTLSDVGTASFTLSGDLA